MIRKLAAVLVVAGALLLAGCSSQSTNTVSAPSVPPAAEATVTSTATPTPTAAASTKSTRGNIVKQIGQAAGITGPSGSDIVDFVVTKIEVDPTCTAKYSQPAENGHFVVLTMNYETTADYATQSGSSQFYPTGWKAIAANGTTFNGNLQTGQSFFCFDDSETIPSTIGPGEKVTGKVVLDVPTTEGTLVYRPIGLSAGWEYSYPAK